MKHASNKSWPAPWDALNSALIQADSVREAQNPWANPQRASLPPPFTPLIHVSSASGLIFQDTNHAK